MTVLEVGNGREISFEFIKDGYETIPKYTPQEHTGKHAQSLLL